MSNVVTNDLTNADLIPTPTPITTGASPVTADINVRHYSITSGGTNAQETIVLPTPTLSGGFNTDWIGQTITFTFGVQTSGSDYVVITGDIGSPLRIEDIHGIVSVGDAGLGGFPATICFTWTLLGWIGSIGFNYANLINIVSSSDYILTTPATPTGSPNINILTGDVSSESGQASGTIYLTTGPAGSGRAAGEIALIVAPSGASADGSSVSLLAGDGGTGDTAGGDILLRAGAGSGAGTHGNVVISDLPTADPHVVNALWNNAGVLTISAG